MDKWSASLHTNRIKITLLKDVISMLGGISFTVKTVFTFESLKSCLENCKNKNKKFQHK